MDVILFLLWTSGFLLFQRYRGWLPCPCPEQYEAVTKTAEKIQGANPHSCLVPEVGRFQRQGAHAADQIRPSRVP
jgi:hypothetical protein